MNSVKFTANDMLSFANFIRDNYYQVGAPKLLSYHPEINPHGTIEFIFTHWCILLNNFKL